MTTPKRWSYVYLNNNTLWGEFIKIKIIFLILIAFSFITTLATLIYSGIILPNNPSKQNYPIRGVDVSSYQGIINWDILSKQGIDFAYIKATEGSSFVDNRFSYNWEHANTTSLRIGAYHFFSFDSSGLTQAENFIKIVPALDSSLPPVVDFEFYGDKEKNLPDTTKAKENLRVLLEKLEVQYNKKPIIYVTGKSFNLYIKNDFKDYPIWIRNI
jgi:lysozyme